jgi:hypothetical protein
VECELAREFGVEWVPRADGRGNEIAGVTQAQMDAYSTRTVQVREKERELARAWDRKHGRAPTSRELLRIANAATLQSRAGKDHHLEAGEPGRPLANGDVLRIEAITGRGIMARRMLDPDPATGQRRFTSQAFRYTAYQSADLAYAVTGHSAQGATVHTGIALVTGSEDRQWLYPAMTRGTDTNLAYVFTAPARPTDPQPAPGQPQNSAATSASAANARDSWLSSLHQIPEGRSRASR